MRARVWIERGMVVAATALVSTVLAVVPASAAPGSLLVASATNRPVHAAGETFASYVFKAVEPTGKDTVLSSTPDGLTPMAVDDAMDVQVTHPDGTVATYTHDFSAGCSGTITPILVDLTPLVATGANTVELTLRDQCGANDGNTDIWVDGGGTYSSSGGTPTSRQYVAMGDSYASGEGNPPFDQGTAVKGGDSCHRSQRAFGPLLAHDLGVSDIRFVACSGATTGNIVIGTTPPTNSPTSGTADPEQLQVNALTSTTRFVTIMVGGDDLDFADVLLDCVTYTCPLAARQPGTAVHNLDRKLDALQPVLAATYTAIKKAAPNAVVDVVGYPDLVPPKPSLLQDAGSCANDSGLVGGSLGYLAKRQARLQAIIQDAAHSAGVNFVDPNAPGKPYSFLGHDVCAGKAWFIRLENRHVSSATFHPTTTGQRELEQAVLDNDASSALAPIPA